MIDRRSVPTRLLPSPFTTNSLPPLHRIPGPEPGGAAPPVLPRVRGGRCERRHVGRHLPHLPESELRRAVHHERVRSAGGLHLPLRGQHAAGRGGEKSIKGGWGGVEVTEQKL